MNSAINESDEIENENYGKLVETPGKMGSWSKPPANGKPEETSGKMGSWLRPPAIDDNEMVDMDDDEESSESVERGDGDNDVNAVNQDDDPSGECKAESLANPNNESDTAEVSPPMPRFDSIQPG